MKPPNEIYDIVISINPKSTERVCVTFVSPPANMHKIA